MSQKLPSVHLWATWQKNHGAKTDKYTNTQKTPSEKKCSSLFFCVFVYAGNQTQKLPVREQYRPVRGWVPIRERVSSHL